MLPWSAFVFAGAVLGTAIDGSTERLRPVWFQAAVAGAGATLFAGGVWSALRPMLFPDAYFWTTSPAYVAVRVGLMLAMVPLAWLWTSRPWRAPDRSSPLETFGTGSLFVYWVHVELVYGFASRSCDVNSRWSRELWRGLPWAWRCTSYCWAGTAWALGAANSLTVLQDQ